MDSSQRVRAILSFVQAADAGSFAAAARVLGVSSAAVSKNVAGLEQALGVRLMNRTTRTLSLTAEGAAFLQKARIALDALDTAVDEVAAQRVGPLPPRRHAERRQRRHHGVVGDFGCDPADGYAARARSQHHADGGGAPGRRA